MRKVIPALQFAVCIVLLVSFAVPVQARNITSPESYVFNRGGADRFIATPAPLPYRFVRSVQASDVGVNTFINLMEIEYHDERFFITNGDTLIVTDNDFNATDIIRGIEVDGRWEYFTALDGIFITFEGEIYVAEPGAGRILHFDAELNLIRVLGRPEGILIDDEIPYRPTKVAVDNHGRIYVVAENVFQGIVEMNPDGTFNRFFGVVEVRFTATELFLRSLQTQAQRARARLWLPVNFTNLAVDPDGFIFATMSDAGTDVGAKKLNARGENIMRRPFDDHFVGDLYYNTFGFGVPIGPSIMSIIQVNDFGVYYLFDSNRNRVFAYDQDGHMLFAFGGSGTREGFTQSVTGMTMASGSRLVFADRGNRSIEVFRRTQYGELVLSAVERQFHNDYMGAAYYWRQVIDMNQFFQYAHLGVGIALYRQGLFEEAIPYFQRGQAVDFYSMAFQRVRADNMYQNFNMIVLSVLVLVVIIVVVKVYRRLQLIRKDRGIVV